MLWTNGEITSVDLSGKTLLAAASLVGIIDRLEKKDLVSRVRSSADRRAVYIVATARSRELEAEVSPQVAAIQARVRAIVTEREWAAMEKTLRKVASALQAESGESTRSANG